MVSSLLVQLTILCSSFPAQVEKTVKVYSWEFEERLSSGITHQIELHYAEPFTFRYQRQTETSVMYGMSDGKSVHTFRQKGKRFVGILRFNHQRLAKSFGESEAAARLFVVATGGMLTVFDPTKKDITVPQNAHLQKHLKREGKEKVGLWTCDVFTSAGSEQWTYRLWFDEADGLLVKMTLSNRDGKLESSLTLKKKEAYRIPKSEVESILVSFDEADDIRDLTDQLLPQKKP